jgi:hypothetical protein
MTTELTHEQAAEIRTYLHNGRQPPEHLKWRLRWEDWNLVSLTEAGREALAAYDAKWCIVEKRDVATAMQHILRSKCCVEMQEAFERLDEALK